MVTGYSHRAAFDSGVLSVGVIHKLHYEQYGNQDGKPVIFLHGGPGTGTSIGNTAFFDPSVYRVLLLDQRGAGKSRPVAETRENTSQHLVADIETLRKHLHISKWHMVFGGSWGSTLALLYAQTYPAAVGSLVLRGIFCGRKLETDYVNGAKGAAMLFPEQYDNYINYLPLEDRHDPFQGYHKLLSSPDHEVRRAAAKVYNSYEFSLSKVEPQPEDYTKLEDDDFSLAHGVLECHYFQNNIFLEDGELLRPENIDKIKHIPSKQSCPCWHHSPLIFFQPVLFRVDSTSSVLHAPHGTCTSFCPSPSSI